MEDLFCYRKVRFLQALRIAFEERLLIVNYIVGEGTFYLQGNNIFRLIGYSSSS